MAALLGSDPGRHPRASGPSSACSSASASRGPFVGPAVQSLLPNVVTLQELPTAIAWNSSAWQVATIVGPVAGGLLYGLSALAATAPRALASGRPDPGEADRHGASAGAGRACLLEHGRGRLRVCLAPQDPARRDLARSLRGLLGGAVALMPAYARDILEVGPVGPRPAAGGPGHRRDPGRRLPRRAADQGSCRPHHVRERCRLRPVHDPLRPVDRAMAVRAHARPDGRVRHGQRLCAGDPHPARHARRRARPGERREHGVRRRVERTRRIPGRRVGGR